ncbi:glutamate 5-kinase [Gracilinema caldarium]|uniref:Glutamate 5-kinase n=1 Tax=Gracilinema caldarium (strain ATCC 51460 / DSM 7334 / H1) TaxID=744872 RepID=F8F0D1_GRAC1|nr:glutamate 5-kinase [Gracilinema caldarium]AEJ18995.1 Glutamate 5-kinase [Gracilinema caldarium DSM 7334]
MIPQLIDQSRKIVIKVGSNTLADKQGHINRAFLSEFAEQVAGLLQKGKQIVLVSSGARIAGISTIGKWERKRDIHYKQALCAVGQVELMEAWRKAFEPHQIHIGQLLLTADDFSNDIRTLHMRNTLFTLVDEGVVPIINENDSVCVDEIKIGDNDNLAALSAILWSADLLILFSDIDGVYTKNPKEHQDAELIEMVQDLSALKASISVGSTNSFGTGGIATKLEAAEKVLSYGIPMILAHGGKNRVLESLQRGEQRGTAFIPAGGKP